MAIESIGLVAVTENAAKKLAVKASGKIKAHTGTKYLLQVENSDVAPEIVTVKRVGKDLLVQFEGSDKPDLTIEDFFADDMDGQLYGVAEDGQLYAYVRTDGEGFGGPLLLADGDAAPIAVGGDVLANGSPYLASRFDDATGFVVWPWLIGLAGIGTAAAIIRHNQDSGHHHGQSTSPAPTNMRATDDIGPIQGRLQNGDVTDDTHPEITGNGVPGSVIHVFDNGKEIASTTVAADGTWSFTLEFGNGAHSIGITQEAPGHKPSTPVDVVDIVVDTPPLTVPIAEIEGARTDDSILTLSGEAEVGTIVTVYDNGDKLGSATADKNVDWSYSPTTPLGEGEQKFTVDATDQASSTRAKSDPFPIITDYSGPDDKSIQLTIDSVTSDNTISSVESKGNVTISGKVTGEFVVGDKVSFKLDRSTYSAVVDTGAPSAAFPIQGQSWTKLAINDLNRNVTNFGNDPVYRGGGVTITSNTTLAHSDAVSCRSARLLMDGDINHCKQLNFTVPVSDVAFNISALQGDPGAARVVIYDISGNVLFDEKIPADGSAGVPDSAKFSYRVPIGTDIGKVQVYGDGVGAGTALDTLKLQQIHHAPGYDDTLTNDVGKTGAFHSDEGHFTLSSKGTISIRSATQHNLGSPYLYIDPVDSPMSNSAAIFTFGQPMQSIAYHLWDLETQKAIAENGSWLEAFDTNGNLIFNRFVSNNGGSTYSYEQISCAVSEGTSVGKAVVYRGTNNTLLDNFITTLASSTPSGQKLIDHNWETFFDEASAAKAVEWHGQSFSTRAFDDKASMVGYHSADGGFTISGRATKTAAGSIWVNAMQGSMCVGDGKTAVATFDTARSKVEVSATGIEKGNAAILKVFDTDGKLLDSLSITNPYGQTDIQRVYYETDGNKIGRIEITGESGGTHVTSISSAETQVTVEHDVISMVVDPVAYFAQDSAHIHGSSGLDTLGLIGAGQVLNLTQLIGDNDQAKISSVEKFDITGTGNNTLKISLNDVLYLGETDLFRKGGKVQVMVDGDAGDKVQLANLHDHGTAPGAWQAVGTTSIGGSTYPVYSYSNPDAEVLIQQAVTVAIV
ncbi:hypothetical protein IB260_04935 [Pseudomonas sp. PDM23]|uniref:Ig-like domain-containing protein n=1 Tax=unclassified Pseudomonas TaxID=196821 RepID=UPI00177E8637|nr:MULTISPECIES: Ig-like domain-containing protein [unclassified Pseudomonas]MBD9574650.1 hypothetical protein [Pseudomonas sp. PDM23]MBD9673929.1 hypothetical protein [Pseudomonas sp. PDM21]